MAVGGAERPVEAVEVVEHDEREVEYADDNIGPSEVKEEEVCERAHHLVAGDDAEHERVAPRAHKRDRRECQPERAARPPGADHRRPPRWRPDTRRPRAPRPVVASSRASARGARPGRAPATTAVRRVHRPLQTGLPARPRQSPPSCPTSNSESPNQCEFACHCGRVDAACAEADSLFIV